MTKLCAVLLAIAGFAAAQTSPGTVPSQLQAPADQELLLRAHGVGDQVYVCTADGNAYKWTLKAPDARLLTSDGAPVGHHFAGPTWEAQDGSRVMGKVMTTVPSPQADSIPWLLLQASKHEGNGVMTSVLTIQRINTQGGKAPATGCDSAHAETEVRVPYQADYRFYGEANEPKYLFQVLFEEPGSLFE